jgi:uncharacterized protein (DUF2062 family)
MIVNLASKSCKSQDLTCVSVSTYNFSCVVHYIRRIIISMLTLNDKMEMKKDYEQMSGLWPNTLNALLLCAILLGLHSNLRF